MKNNLQLSLKKSTKPRRSIIQLCNEEWETDFVNKYKSTEDIWGNDKSTFTLSASECDVTDFSSPELNESFDETNLFPLSEYSLSVSACASLLSPSIQHSGEPENLHTKDISCPPDLLPEELTSVHRSTVLTTPVTPMEYDYLSNAFSSTDEPLETTVKILPDAYLDIPDINIPNSLNNVDQMKFMTAKVRVLQFLCLFQCILFSILMVLGGGSYSFVAIPVFVVCIFIIILIQFL